MEENHQTSISDSNGQSPMSAVYGNHENGGGNISAPRPAADRPNQSRMKKYVALVWELIKILAFAAIIVLPIRYFLFQPFIVKGDSMVPNFHSGDYLIVDEISYRFSSPGRGDVVVLRYPLDTTQRFIKRIIGLPGETVDINNGKITITQANGTSITLHESYIPTSLATDGSVHVTLGPDAFFTLGDNRPFSYDSRRWGVLPKEDIIGRAMLRIFPVTNLSLLTEPTY